LANVLVATRISVRAASPLHRERELMGLERGYRIQFNMGGGGEQGVAGAENVQSGSITFGTPPKA
jgi:hypothetical protein